MRPDYFAVQPARTSGGIPDFQPDREDSTTLGGKDALPELLDGPVAADRQSSTIPLNGDDSGPQSVWADNPVHQFHIDGRVARLRPRAPQNGADDPPRQMSVIQLRRVGVGERDDGQIIRRVHAQEACKAYDSSAVRHLRSSVDVDKKSPNP